MRIIRLLAFSIIDQQTKKDLHYAKVGNRSIMKTVILSNIGEFCYGSKGLYSTL